MRVPPHRLSINRTPIERLLIDFSPARASIDIALERLFHETPFLLPRFYPVRKFYFGNSRELKRKKKKEIEVDRRVNEKR